MNLTENDVLKILKIVEESNFEEIRLTMDNLNLVVRKGNGKSTIDSESDNSLSGDMSFNKTTQPNLDSKLESGIKEEKKVQPEKVSTSSESAGEEDLVPIKASLLGVVYLRPEPTAPPFVEVGSYVEEDTTVCLIEVMKVFSAVKAGVRGYVEKICVDSGNLVEYGQILFLIRP